MRWYVPVLGLAVLGGAVTLGVIVAKAKAHKMEYLERHGVRIYLDDAGRCHKAEVFDADKLQEFAASRAVDLVRRGVTEPTELVLVVFQEAWPECPWPPVEGTPLADAWKTAMASGLVDDLREAISREQGLAGAQPGTVDPMDTADLGRMISEFLR